MPKETRTNASSSRHRHSCTGLIPTSSSSSSTAAAGWTAWSRTTVFRSAWTPAPATSPSPRSPRFSRRSTLTWTRRSAFSPPPVWTGAPMRTIFRAWMWPMPSMPAPPSRGRTGRRQPAMRPRPAPTIPSCPRTNTWTAASTRRTASGSGASMRRKTRPSTIIPSSPTSVPIPPRPSAVPIRSPSPRS